MLTFFIPEHARDVPAPLPLQFRLARRPGRAADASRSPGRCTSSRRAGPAGSRWTPSSCSTRPALPGRAPFAVAPARGRGSPRRRCSGAARRPRGLLSSTCSRSAAGSTGSSSASFSGARTASGRSANTRTWRGSRPTSCRCIYAAALFTDSADRVAAYLVRYGKAGAEDLRLALGYGQGAVNLLLLRQVPVNRRPARAGERRRDCAAASAAHAGGEVPRLFPRRFLILRGLDRWIVSPSGDGAAARAVSRACRAGVLAVLSPPPHRRHRALPAEGRAALGIPFPPVIPMLATSATPTAPPATSNSRHHGNLHTRLDRRVRRAPGRHVPDLPPQDP